MGSGPAVVAEEVRKRYGKTEALAGFNLTVPTGSVWGLLGPNGAGKTTAIRILSTLLRLDGGRAQVAGFDVATQAREVRYNIGLVGQNAAVDEALSARQNLVMFGRLYHIGTAAAKKRAEELLEQFDLTETGNKPISSFSGGMRRRLDLAASLILAPPVIFLDEPSTGLDPRGRNEVWDSIRTLVDHGTTALLTTQYLDEADQLADHISLIDHGRVVAEGTPEELKSTIGGDHIDLTLKSARDEVSAREILRRVASGEPEFDQDSRRLSAPIAHRFTAVTEAVRALDTAGIDVEDLSLRRPTLDEVFLHLTGKTDQPDDGSTDVKLKEELAR